MGRRRPGKASPPEGAAEPALGKWVGAAEAEKGASSAAGAGGSSLLPDVNSAKAFLGSREGVHRGKPLMPDGRMWTSSSRPWWVGPSVFAEPHFRTAAPSLWGTGD